MKIWHKIVAAPAIAIVFLALLGGLSFGVLTRHNAALEDMYKHRFGNYQLAANSAQAIGEVHSSVYRLLTWIANLKEDKIKQAASEQGARIDDVTKKVAAFAAGSAADAQERQLAESIVRKLGKYKTDINTALDLSTADVNAGVLAMQTADSGFQSLLKDLNQLVQVETRLAEEHYASASSAFATVIVVLLSFLVVAVAVSGVMTYVMSRAIVRPLGHAITLAGRIAKGDLTTGQTAVTGRDETAQLLQALTDMTTSLQKIVGDVRSSAEAIDSGTTQIAAGNADLSQRTEEQASSLEETASSMEELTSTVKQNADNAHQANQLAISASEVAARGGGVVGEVVNTMASINDSSRKIVDIISVIDGIAFQTNILALNAAVEAARAGEQGRGFAVVASEVRSLAQRSAAAAKEIKGLITDSVGKVENGTRLVGAAGQTMDEIVGSIKRVTDLMGEIAAASEEQTRGIEQVNQAITQMDQVTQQNAALVEEAAAAAESLREQAGGLVEAVSVFKIVNNEAGIVESATPAPRGASVTALRRRKVAQVKSAVECEPMAQPRKIANARGRESEWQEF